MEPLKFEAFCVNYMCRALDSDFVGGRALMMIQCSEREMFAIEHKIMIVRNHLKFGEWRKSCRRSFFVKSFGLRVCELRLKCLMFFARSKV